MRDEAKAAWNRLETTGIRHELLPVRLGDDTQLSTGCNPEMAPREDPSAGDTAPASALFQATARTKSFDGCRVVAVDLELVEGENGTMVRRTLELLEP
jgi:hypothetical protein